MVYYFMKYTDDQGIPISGFYDLNKEIIETNKKTMRMCTNPECSNISYLQDDEVPHIMLGRVCWNCKSANFLKDYSG